MSLPLVLLGACLCFASHWQYEPRAIPGDKLVILVAKFTAISPGAEEEARNISDRIEEMLLEKENSGAPLQIKRTSKAVEGTMSPKSRSLHLCLANRKTQCPPSYLGGSSKGRKELYVKSRITIAQDLRGHLRDASLAPVRSVQPSNLELQEHLAADISDLVTLSYGLAYFRVGDCDNALRFWGTSWHERNTYSGDCVHSKRPSNRLPRTR